jgi:hypothetical protein
MKLITIEGGRVLDLVPTEEFRSRRGVYLPEFVQAIVSRYGFIAGPNNLADAIKNGAKFETGKFIVDGETVAIKELAIYNDGLIADAYDSRFADMLLDDFSQWATDTFGLQQRSSPFRRTYTSALVCIFDKAVESGLGKLAGLTKLFSQSLREAYGWDYKYDLFRLGFNVDPKTIPHLRSTNFLFERRGQANYAENRYYCVAPLRTDDHIQLLEKIETEFLS